MQNISATFLSICIKKVKKNFQKKQIDHKNVSLPPSENKKQNQEAAQKNYWA